MMHGLDDVDDRSSRRGGIGLCLSGGGFRASLFHLGAVRRLHELGILQNVNWVSAVSGGSILAACLMQCQKEYGVGGKLQFSDWQAEVSDKFRAIASRDLRTWPVILNFLWNWLYPNSLLRCLENRYRKRVTNAHLRELPESPIYIFCATDLSFGVNWEFTREHVGSYQAGYLAVDSDKEDAKRMTVAKAIAASACFPPLFGPMRLGIKPNALTGGNYRARNRDSIVAKLALSDGGVYDNMGVEPVWKKAATVLVSDCGAPFQFESGKEPWRMLLRYPSVIGRQADSVRLRLLYRDYSTSSGPPVYSGCRWNLTAGRSAKSPAWGQGYSDELVQNVISRIRTDLDNFSDAEMSVLENHGYLNADFQIRTWCPQLLATSPLDPAKSLNVPYPQLMKEDLVRKALRDSSRRLVWGRLRTGLFG